MKNVFFNDVSVYEFLVCVCYFFGDYFVEVDVWYYVVKLMNWVEFKVCEVYVWLCISDFVIVEMIF